MSRGKAIDDSSDPACCEYKNPGKSMSRESVEGASYEPVESKTKTIEATELKTSCEIEE